MVAEKKEAERCGPDEWEVRSQRGVFIMVGGSAWCYTWSTIRIIFVDSMPELGSDSHFWR